MLHKDIESSREAYAVPCRNSPTRTWDPHFPSEFAALSFGKKVFVPEGSFESDDMLATLQYAGNPLHEVLHAA